MPESEIWITRIFNDYLPGVGNAALHLVGRPSAPRPWADFVVMQFVVVAILMAIALILRSRLSVNSPGRLQHSFELFYEFVNGQAKDQVGHQAGRYVAY